MFHDLVLDGGVVAVLRVVSNLTVDVRILGEDRPKQELLAQCKRLHFCQRHMHKLRLYVIAEVVVAEERIAAELVRNSEPASIERLLVKMVAYADRTRRDEVHLEHFLLLIVDDVFVLILSKIARHQSKRNIVEEFAVLIPLGVEKYAKVIKDIVEEVVHDDAALDATRKRIDEVIILVDLIQAVVVPKVLEVLVDLSIE